MSTIIASCRIAVGSMLLCVLGYSSVILGFARTVARDSSEGSLIRTSEGKIIGSRALAQGFRQARYFWPRPSAVDYNASASGGSNQSPHSPKLAERAKEMVERFGATGQRPLPVDLVTASGSGLDPLISERAAHFQIDRVAAARGMSAGDVESMVVRLAYTPGSIFTQERVVNVLQLNCALDGIKWSH